MESPLVSRVLKGEDRRLTLMAADGLLPLPPEELIPLQVKLAVQTKDEEIRDRAEEGLHQIEPTIAERYLKHDAKASTLAWFGENTKRASLLEIIIGRKEVPNSVLSGMAEHLIAELQEILLLRQDAILEEPKILDALERNPEISFYSRRLVAEYRQHLLKPDSILRIGDRKRGEGEASDGEIAEAIRKVCKENPASTDEVLDDVTGLTGAQLRLLPVNVRVGIAFNCPRSLRQAMLRDVNSKVAVMTLKNNPFGDGEIEIVAKNRAVSEEVLEEISKHREWVRKYPIKLSLVQNPKSPLSTTMKFLPSLSVRDLRLLSRDRNIPDALRSRARRLFNMKMK